MSRKSKIIKSSATIFEVVVPTIFDFLTILAAREQSQDTLFIKIQGAIRRWLSAASARKLLTQRAVVVTPIHRRILSAQGLLETTHSFALSFTFKDTLVTYLHKLPEQVEMGHTDNCPAPTGDHARGFSVTKLQLELAIATLGLAVPVIVGSLISHREEGTHQELKLNDVQKAADT